MKTETAPLALRLELRRTFDFPVERVFTAWTDIRQLATWLGGDCATQRRVEGEFRVGGVCHFLGEGENGPCAVDIKCREIVPNSRIVFTWTAVKSSCGNDGDTTVTVTFRALGQKTEVHLVHEGFLTDESRQAHNYGWTSSLEKLALKLA